MNVDRELAARRIRRSFLVHPAVAVVGPRQCGKTTLARALFDEAPEKGRYFDLEDPVDRRRLALPMQTLKPLRGLVVIDEIQRQPELFEILRVLCDRREEPARFLVLGSASPALARGAAETLAGRAGQIRLSGFDLTEVGGATPGGWRRLWLRGGFPRSFLADDDDLSALWRQSFVETFLDRDIPRFGFSLPGEALRRFWMMVAHYHGQVWNAAEFARAIGSGQTAARRYLDILVAAQVVRVLPPWHENLKKRQVRAPKVYVRDSGLLHTLLDLPSTDRLAGHPKVGASFEGLAVEQVLSCLQPSNAHFWGTHGGAELDLMIVSGGRRFGFEFKYSDAPGTTKSMRVALADLRLDHLWVIYPGEETYELDERISVLPVGDVPSLTDEKRLPFRRTGAER
ncbi:MAG: ATP-binding protein [Acidobacteria bacterium]|nr:ATP-binding protein [Acidobacteriota bacterium]